DREVAGRQPSANKALRLPHLLGRTTATSRSQLQGISNFGFRHSASIAGEDRLACRPRDAAFGFNSDGESFDGADVRRTGEQMAHLASRLRGKSAAVHRLGRTRVEQPELV